MTNKKTLIIYALSLVLTAGVIGLSVSAHGLDRDNGSEGGKFFGKKGNTPTAEARDGMRAAVENGDFEAWSSLAAGRRSGEIINQDNFSKMVEMHKLMDAGKYEEARALRAELGLGGKGFGKRLGGGCDGGCDEKGFVDANNDGICDHRTE